MGGKQFPAHRSFSPGILSGAKMKHLYSPREESESTPGCFGGGPGRKGWALRRGGTPREI